MCEGLCSVFADEGIEVVLNAQIRRIAGKSGQSVTIVFEQG